MGSDMEHGLQLLVIWVIWQRSVLQHCCYVSCTAPGPYKSITCPLYTNNILSAIQGSPGQNHAVLCLRVRLRLSDLDCFSALEVKCT